MGWKLTTLLVLALNQLAYAESGLNPANHVKEARAEIDPYNGEIIMQDIQEEETKFKQVLEKISNEIDRSQRELELQEESAGQGYQQ